MAAAEVEAQRALWKLNFKADKPLAGQLDKPFVPAWQVAYVMGLSENSVYTSCKKYNRAMAHGDTVTAYRNIPCLIFGRTHRIPTEAFVAWWETAGRVKAPEGEEVA